MAKLVQLHPQKSFLTKPRNWENFSLSNKPLRLFRKKILSSGAEFFNQLL